MKKKIGIFSLFLVLALVLTLLPGLQTEAEAAAAASITVNGYTLNSGYYLPTTTWTQTKTKPSGSYFYYSSGTLTIHNVTLTAAGNSRAVYAEGDLVVNLSGTNKLTTNNANGIRSAGTLKFTGSGSLTVNSSGYDAIYSSGNMEFAQTGTVTATATGHSSSGVECAAKLTIGGNLNATAESSYAILASGDISMTKGTVNATGNCTFSAGGIRSNGAITVSGGTLNVTSKSDGIISKYDFFQKAGNVTVNADWNGIVVESTTNNIIIHEGTMTVTAARSGLKAQKFYMNGGHGYIKSTNTSYDSSYSAVELAGNSASYYVQKGNVNSYGATTTSSSALTKLVYANLSTYDYVYFTGYITVNGVELRDGYYLPSGKTTADITKPSGGYAYYSGNTLTLNNYQGSNSAASGIDSRYDLNIVVTQGSVNKLTSSFASGTTYRGINVRGTLKISGLGQLTIAGGQYAVYSTGSMTLSTTQVIANGGGIYSGSSMTLSSSSVGVYQLLSPASGTHAIQAAGNITIDGTGGAVYINSPDKVDGSFIRGIVGKNITINSSVGITSSGVGIRGEGNVTINGGTVEVNAKLGSGIVATGTMTIAGGTVDVTAYNNGLSANKLVITGGNVTAVSTYTGNDAANKAIDVPDNTTASFQIPDNYAFLASEETTFSDNEGARYYLGSYDWVHIGDFVMMHGVELRSGYYLASGNSANTPTLVRPSNGGYAYYADGVLTLYNYSYSGDKNVVKAYADLTVTMTGTNSLKATQNSGYCSAIATSYNLTINGDGSADVSSKSWHSIYAFGNITIVGVSLNVSGSDGGIYSGGTTTIFSGYTKVKVTGIGVGCNKLKISGGVLTARSTDDYAIKIRSADSDAYTIGSNMNSVYMSSSIMGTYSTFKQGCTTDSVALGDFILVNGVVVPRGYYLVKGSSTPVKTTTSSTYACVNDSKTLVLKNYSCSSGNDVPCVLTGLPLTIILDGSSTLNSEDDTIYAMSDLTIKCRNSDADKLTMDSDVRQNINCFGKLTMAGGTVSTNTDDCQVITTMNGMTMTGGKLIFTDTLWIQKGDLTISGGEVHAKCDHSTGISVAEGDVTVTGGVVYVESKYGALLIKRGKFSLTGGVLEAKSTNTDEDDSYSAIYLGSTASDAFTLGSGMNQMCTTNSTFGGDKINPDYLEQEDYVALGEFVAVRCVVVPKGYYLMNGSTTPVKTATGSTGYVYCMSATSLIMNNYSYSGTPTAICSNLPLTLHVYGSNSLASDKVRGILIEGDLTILKKSTATDSLTVKAGRYYGIWVSGNMTSNLDELSVQSDVTAINIDGNLTVTGGHLSAVGGENGITLNDNGKLTVTGGMLTAISTDTDFDSDYWAIKLTKNTTDYYNVAPTLSQAASTVPYKVNLEKLNLANMQNYDYVSIGQSIEVGGVTVPDGYSVNGSGNLVKGDGGSGYAYYSNGVLTLNGFYLSTNTGRGINAFCDLTVNVTADSTIISNKYYAIYADDLTIQGSAKLDLTTSTAATVWAVGDVTISGVELFAASSDGTAISAAGTVKVNSGKVTAYGKKYGIDAAKVAVNGGELYARSSNTTEDSSYQAVKGSFSMAAGVYAAGTDSASYAGAQKLDTSRLSSYDFIYAGDYVIVGGVLVPNGNYLGQDTTIPTPSTGATGWVRYTDGKLVLNGFSYTGTTGNGVYAPRDLEIAVSGNSSLSTGTNAAVYVDGDLTLGGTKGVKLTLTSTGSEALYATGDVLIEDITVTATGAGNALYIIGDLTVDFANLTAASTSDKASAVFVESLYVSGGTVNITGKYVGLTLNGTEMKVSAGEVNITSSANNGISGANATINMSAGTLNVTGKMNGIVAKAYNQTGGNLKVLSSAYSAQDASYQALKAGTVTLPASYVKQASTEDSTLNIGNLDSGKLSTYDYICVEPLVIKVNGIGMVDGWYLAEGSPYITHTKPTSGGYAYRSGNKLYLYDMNVTSAGAVGIESNGIFEIINSGASKFSCGEYAPISAGMELVISGSGSLTLTADTTAITCKNYFSTTGVDLTVTSNEGYGIYVMNGDVLINSGNVKVTAKLHAISCQDITVNGGTALLRCMTYGTEDSTYYALAASGNITIADGLAAYGTHDADGSAPGIVDTSKLNTYDYISIKKGTASGVSVSGTVMSYITTGDVTIKLYKSGSTTASYTVKVSGVKGEATAFSFSNVAAGTYTMEVSKANHVTQTYTVTVGSSNVTQDAKICPVGDITGDGKVNMKDWSQLYNHINEVSTLSGYSLACADTNGDGKVNMKDWSILYNHISEIKPIW